MKKYKLIKEYPGNLELGKILDENGFDSDLGTYHQPKNFPEFWEEVIEKDYEILSLQDINNSHVGNIIKFENGIAFGDKPYPVEIELALKNWVNKFKNYVIHSIKRLSDGEVFTIGDKVLPGGNIIKFELVENTIMYRTSSNAGAGLNVMMKRKQPLFTTEDSIDIFENDTFYIVHNTNWNNIQCIAQKNATFSIDSTKKFSTKGKAEEYILMNKPCLSLNEIIEIYKKVKLQTPMSKKFIKELKEIINTKING
jgi:hypothetical protein